jgi:coatomer subunit beta'
MDIALQVEKMFLGQRDSTAPTGIPAADYLTAKDDLDLNLIALIKGQAGGQSQPQQSPEAGESKVPEAQDDEDDEDAAQMAAEAEAQKAAELETQMAAEAEAQMAAEAEAAAAAEAEVEEERVAAEAAAADGGDDFGDEW